VAYPQKGEVDMCLRIICLVLIFVACLNGCDSIFKSLPYSMGWGGGAYWSKKGLDYKEVRQFYWGCYSRMAEIYNRERKNKVLMDSTLEVELEIKGQKCMLEHGFSFKDAPFPHEKLCSNSYIKDRGLRSYMIFPACQAKYGKYRK